MSTDARAIVEAIFFSTSIPMGGASACVFYMTDMWNVGVTLLGGALVLALRADSTRRAMLSGDKTARGGRGS